MDKSLLRDWLKHPVTYIFSELLIEHLKATRDAIADTEWKQDILEKLYRLQGQMYTLDMIGDLEQFLSEKLIIEEVNNDEET